MADGNGGAVVSFDIHIVAHTLLTPVAPLLRRRMADEGPTGPPPHIVMTILPANAPLR